MRGEKFAIASALWVMLAIWASLSADAHEPHRLFTVGETPALSGHISQRDIESGLLSFQEIFDLGARIFTARFNSLDGAGRPESDAAGNPRPRHTFPENFNRVSGPDANSCAGCHFMPRVAGGAETGANNFVGSEVLVDFATTFTPGHERNSLGMFGSGVIEMLAREMTTELQEIRATALSQAAAEGRSVTLPLTTKGVPFGSITARPDGSVDTSGVEGVNADLVIRPFGQAGDEPSLRSFPIGGLNRHLGMQAVEKFGAGTDPDGDGVTDELTAGDITALAIFQAAQAVPGQRIPTDLGVAAAILRGEDLFTEIGCAACHIPALPLKNSIFTEPSPFNPPEILGERDVSRTFAFDLTQQGDLPRLERAADGGAMVRAFTDLKRHDLGPLLEERDDAGKPVRFLTRKLWDVESSMPFLHHGRATTLSQAILAHGGEAEASRRAFVRLSDADQKAVVEFLRSLVILPEGTRALVVDENGHSVDKAALRRQMTVSPPPTPGRPIGDQPALPAHLHQADIDAGLVSLEDLLAHGEAVFTAQFNSLDGAGRPGISDTGADRDVWRHFPDNFNRVSGPDFSSCAGCHSLPAIGGGGENNLQAFVQASVLGFNPFVLDLEFTNSISPTVSNERTTLGMFGSGAIEMLAREMTADLQAIRARAKAQARAQGTEVTLPLDTKGVNFGSITARPGGGVDTRGVEGVNPDLIIRPFSQKGVVPSLRVFTVGAANFHMGMQAVERFGDGTDPDSDGVTDELTRGDLTAISLFQAALPIPGQRVPAGNPEVARAILAGERLFNDIGCAVCHRPKLILDNSIFTEPGPFNPPGNLRVEDVPQPFGFDLTREGPPPRLERTPEGEAIVRAFTDLKRHYMGEALDNEKIRNQGVSTGVFVTKKLWGMASEPPFLHHGRATTITEAILVHGGKAQESRDLFVSLPEEKRAEIVEFLQSLVILPEDAEGLVVDENSQPVDKRLLGEQLGIHVEE